MKKIYIKKSVITGSTTRKPGETLDMPDDVSEADAKALIKGGWAVDADVKHPSPEKEADVIAALEKAKTKPDVDKAVDAVEKPTENILKTAAAKVKSFTARPPYKRPGARAR